MGTDIHLWVEKNISGEWTAIEGENISEINFYQSALEENEEKGENSTCKHMSEEYLIGRIKNAKKPSYNWLYDGRNYNLFAILADVRNGRVFAGVKTGEGYNPITIPKGVPNDASDVYKREVEMWGTDAHSESYLTLKELKEYDWNQTTTSYGIVPEHYYRELRKNGERPTSYFGGISGRNVEVVDMDHMDAIIISNEIIGERKSATKYYVRMEWESSYKDNVGTLFCEDVIKVLEDISDSEELDDVRIVFFFDN